MIVKTFKNYPVDSNCYLIYTEDSKECIIIDPGTNGSLEVISFIQANGLSPVYILLTHEHFDHIWGVNALIDYAHPTLICNAYCAQQICDSKKNLSLFNDQIGFVISAEIVTAESINFILYWNNFSIHMLNTPGHSDGSMCIYMESALFSGDFLINETATVTKLPGGSKAKLKQSIADIISLNQEHQFVTYGGHDEPFTLEPWLQKFYYEKV